MASVKATFTLDPEAARKLEETAERLRRPKSQVVREAIIDYSERADRLSERERLRLLESFDNLVPKIPSRSAADVDAELAQIRADRQLGGRGGGGGDA